MGIESGPLINQLENVKNIKMVLGGLDVCKKLEKPIPFSVFSKNQMT